MMKQIFLFTVISLFLCGCGKELDKFISFLSGEKTNEVILTDKPIELTDKAIVFEPKKPAKVVGEEAAVCLALRGDIPLGPQQKMDSEFKSFMNNADVFVDADTPNGKSFKFCTPMQSWSKYGHILPDDELSACMRVKCGEEVPKGTEFVKFSITTSKPITVKGIYWESTNAWDDIN